MKYPDGYYWEYPGFPSFIVLYEKSSDFFFSGIKFLTQKFINILKNKELKLF